MKEDYHDDLDSAKLGWVGSTGSKSQKVKKVKLGTIGKRRIL